MNHLTLLVILVFICGFIVGKLQERWVYFTKTGEHLQDVKKKDLDKSK